MKGFLLFFLSKLIHGFTQVVACFSHPPPNQDKLKFDQSFEAHWRFCFCCWTELTLLKVPTVHHVGILFKSDLMLWVYEYRILLHKRSLSITYLWSNLSKDLLKCWGSTVEVGESCKHEAAKRKASVLAGPLWWPDQKNSKSILDLVNISKTFLFIYLN